MTEHETNGMDEYGLRIGRELHALSARALQPFDAVVVTHQAAAAHPGASRSFGLGGVVSRSRTSLVVLLGTAILLAALIGAGLLGGGAAPRPAPVVGDIVFAHAIYDPIGRDRPKNLAIFAITSDGGDPKRLAGVPGNVPWPVSGLVGPAVASSPDGTRIAFRLLNDEPGIWLMDRDGSDLHRLVDLPLDEAPRVPFLAALDWSPDGTRLAYTYPYDGVNLSGEVWRSGDPAPLYVVEVDRGRVNNLTGDDPTRGVTRTLAWSPDGSRIAFARTESADHDGLFVMNADGTGEDRLTDEQLVGHIRGLTWAPDGSRVAFVWDSDPASSRMTLKVVGADGSGLRDISSWSSGGCCFLEATDLTPIAWSPVGDQIALVLDMGLDLPDGQAPTIALVRADGSGQTELTKGFYFDMSPDGSRFVVADARLDADVESYSIYVINIDGTGRKWIAEGEFPAWAPVR